jgi:hypothetical protein
MSKIMTVVWSWMIIDLHLSADIYEWLELAMIGNEIEGCDCPKFVPRDRGRQQKPRVAIFENLAETNAPPLTKM